MRRLTVSLAVAAAGLFMAPNVASALSAVTATSTNLRAGPAFDFPVVDRIPSDVRVNVHGCVRGYRWCDVSWRDARGWIPGQELAYVYNGRRVTIVEYGPRIGLPVVGFTFDTYWDRYYRSRPFYSERTRWRTVWRDHDRGDRRTSDRRRDRREGRVESRTDRREGRVESRTDRRQVDRTDRTRSETRRDADRRSTERSDRRPDRGDRNLRTGRGESRDRGEARGYNPPMKSAPRQDMDRGMRQGGGSGDRAGPSMGGDRGGQRGGQGGSDKGGAGQGERRP